MSSDDLSEKAALLFEECLEFSDPAKQTVFLAAACAGDPKLREEVEALLCAHQACGRFLGGGTPPRRAAGDRQAGAESTDLAPGDCVGPYRLTGLIGEGATSVVFLAEQEQPVRRWVAIKIIKQGMDTRNVIARFGLERQALALMDHPGIARLFDAGATSNGRPFFVMELVSGVNITRYCDEHRLSLHQRLDLLVDVCSAVSHAHQKGIIHRDLKPDNVLVSDVEGQPALKIIDFGIAKVLRTWDLQTPTQTGGMPFLGTPAYMSPEQAQMMSPDVDTRTDIYSLGALMYELLTGHPPFDHEELLGAGLEEMCRIIRTVEPVPPSERVAGLPPEERAALAATRAVTPAELVRTLVGDLDWITLKALEKPRDRRYATTIGLAEDVGRHFKALPVQAAAPSRRYRLSKLLQRNRKLVVATSVVGALLLGSTFVSIFMSINARASARQAQERGSAASRAERQSHHALVAMHVASGLAAADAFHDDRATLWFAHAARVAGPNDYQSEVNSRRTMCWMNRVSMPVGAFKLPSAPALLAFSRDARYLLAVDQDGNWCLWDAWSMEKVPWSQDLPGVRAATWSPEGSRLALVKPTGQVCVYEASTGTLLHVFEVRPAPAAIGFTPDARYLVVGNTTVRVFDLVIDAEAREPIRLSERVVGLSMAGTASRAIVVTADDRAQIIELAAEANRGEARTRIYPHRQAIRTDSCSNKSNYREDFLEAGRPSLPVLPGDGSRLLTRTGPYQITFWDTANGTPVHTVDEVCCSCRFIVSPAIGLIACGLDGGEVGMWDIATGAPRQRLPTRGACILDIAFDQAGKHLVTAEARGMARVWAVEQGKETQSPLHHCTDVDQVAFAGNERLVATAQSDGLVRVWNVLDAQDVPPPPSRNEVPTVVRMDHAGQYFVRIREPNWDASIRRLAVYRTSSPRPAGTTIQVDADVEAATFSPDSRLMAVGLAPSAAGRPGRIAYVSLPDMQFTGHSVALPTGPLALAWNPTGPDVAVVCRSGEVLVTRPDLETVQTWSTAIVSPRTRANPMTAFTPDGTKLVALLPDGRIHVYASATSALQYPPLASGPDGFWSFALDADSRRMATTTIGGDVAVWDLQRGIRTGPLLQHPGWVYRCRFSPRKDSLVTAAHDGKVRVWDLASGTLIAGPLAHPSEVYDAAFTPNQRWVLTACRDGNVRIWDLGSEQLVSPPVNVGRQAFNIEFTKGGQHAVIGSLGKDLFAVSLDALQQDLPYDPATLCLLTEVISGCTLRQGEILDLTTSEWLSRYERIRRLGADPFRLGQAYGLTIWALEEKPMLARSSPSHEVQAGMVTPPSLFCQPGDDCPLGACSREGACCGTPADRADSDPESDPAAQGELEHGHSPHEPETGIFHRGIRPHGMTSMKQNGLGSLNT